MSKFLMSIIFVAVALAGCEQARKPVYEAMLDPSPPKFGSGTMTQVADFLPGMWALASESSVNHAAMRGTANDGADHDKIWEFKKDGTIIMHVKALEGKVSGTWKQEGDHITCTYTTFNGKTLAKAHEDFQKASETGRTGAIRGELMMDWLFNDLPNMSMLKLSDDKVTMEFVNPAMGNLSSGLGQGAPADSPFGSVNSLLKQVQFRLMRLKP